MDNQSICIEKIIESHDYAILLGLRATKVLLDELPEVPAINELIHLNDTLLDIVHDSKLRGHHYGTRNLFAFYDRCKELLEGFQETQEVI